MSFQSLGLSKPLLDALAAKDYSQATPIQLQAIPTVLTGRDLLGIAQTGTGKTAAFMLPSLDRLAAAREDPEAGPDPDAGACPDARARLADRSQRRAYGKFMRLSVGVIFGGAPNSKSLRTVARGLDVLVATPGRLLDLIDQRASPPRARNPRPRRGRPDARPRLHPCAEAHRPLVPAKRQTLFFSATMPKAIKELADKYLTNPAEVSVTPAATTVERIHQSVTMVEPGRKDGAARHAPAG